MDQNHVRSTKRALSQKRRELTIDPDLLANFSTEELNTTMLAVKSGKTASFDGVYPEFIKNYGHMEAGFQRKLKTDVVFIDLTASYAPYGGMAYY
jgi:hypothetical protein